MAEKKDRTRPEQKSFTLKGARAPYEAWCFRNGYDERTIMLAGWFATMSMPHEDRLVLFRAVQIAEGRAGGPDFSEASISTALEQARHEERERKGVSPAARPAENKSRPAEKTPSRESRRAG